MVQILVPISTPLNSGFSVVGSGTAHGATNEGVLTSDDDATYVSSSSTADELQLSITAIDYPGTDEDYTLRIRHKYEGAGTPGVVEVSVLGTSGWTVANTFTTQAGTWVTTAIRLTPADVAAFIDSDFATFKIRLRLSVAPSSGHIRISAVQLEAPDSVEIVTTRARANVLAGAPAPTLRVTRARANVLAGAPAPTLRVTRARARVLLDIPQRLVTTRVRANVLIRVQSGSVSALPLPDRLPEFFGMNWSDPFVLETAFNTSVSYSPQSGAEERVGLWGRPSRKASAPLIGTSIDASRRLFMYVSRFTSERMPFPIYSDFGKITEESSGAFISCETKDRRFWSGQHVAVVTPEYRGLGPWPVEFKTIASVEPTGLRLHEDLDGVFDTRGRVYPLIDCEKTLSMRGGAMTDQLFSIGFSANEVVGPSALPADGEEDAAEFEQFEGFPVFDFQPQWATEPDITPTRRGETYQSGRSEIVKIDGSRPIFVVSFALTFLKDGEADRSNAMRFVRFFSTRRGRLLPFLALLPLSAFEAVEIAQTYVDVVAGGDITDVQSFVERIGVLMRDGSIHIRKIDSAEDLGGGTWRLVIDADHPLPILDLDDVRRTTVAMLCRFDSDTLRESWDTNLVMQTHVIVRGLENEVDSAIDDPSAAPAIGGPADIPNLYLWASMAKNGWRREAVVEDVADLRLRLAEDGDVPSLIDDVRTITNGKTPTYPCIGIDTQFGWDPTLRSFSSSSYANGKRVLAWGQKIGAARLGVYDFGLSEKAPFWSNTDGLTIFIAFRSGTDNAEVSEVFKAFDVLNRNGVLEWSYKQIRFFSTEFVETPAHRISYSVDPWTQAFEIWCLTWKPGNYARLYRNGGAPLASASTPAPSLPLVEKETYLLNIQSGSEPIGEEASLDTQYKNGDGMFWSEFIIYSRALSKAELNNVGDHLSSIYHKKWDTIP